MAKYTNEQFREAIEKVAGDEIRCPIRIDNIEYLGSSAQITVKSRSGKEKHVLHYDLDEEGHLNVWGGYPGEASRMAFAHQVMYFLRAL